MNQFIYTWAVALAIMSLVDYVWLQLTLTRFYKFYLGLSFAAEVSYFPVIVFYLMYTGGLVYVLLLPALKYNLNLYQITLRAMIIGCMAYGAYDLTNQATIGGWSSIVSIVDIAWGMFVTGLTSSLTVIIIKKCF